MDVIAVKNIAQSCSNLLQKYKGRPEKGKICIKVFAEISDLCSRFENLIQVIFMKSGLKITSEVININLQFWKTS